jgi:1-acyl-sn-glycerol-3-phosphate acyltransferase
MSSLYTPVRAGARWFLDAFARVSVEGLEHLPERGGFLVLPNHQSALDPVVVQSYCPRRLHAMTKSTQFRSGFFRWILPRLASFPVRRYRIDPQSVRVVLGRLEEGEGVCIYPEGERSWDGTLQSFRQGTMRLMLAAGVPVIPCGIDGTYDVLPRWRKRPSFRHPVTLRFGRPLRFGPYADRAARDAALPAAEAELREVLFELSGERSRAPADDPHLPGIGAGGAWSEEETEFPG